MKSPDYKLYDLSKSTTKALPPEEYRVIRNYNYNQSFNLKGTFSASGIVLDVETTGLDVSDGITEIGVIVFTYDPVQKIVGSITHRLSYFNNPGRPIRKEIVELTGITDEMVKGHTILSGDINKELNYLFASTTFIIAHNAAFDRKFIEKAFPHSTKKVPWLCSMADVAWKVRGMKHQTLEYLSLMSGFFFKGHRAADDAHATLGVLAADSQVDGQEAPIKELLTLYQQGVVYKVTAAGAPFAQKDMLKARGYNFDGSRKAWFKVFLDTTEASTEANYLCSANICNRRNMEHILKKIILEDRFSERE